MEITETHFPSTMETLLLNHCPLASYNLPDMTLKESSDHCVGEVWRKALAKPQKVWTKKAPAFSEDFPGRCGFGLCHPYQDGGMEQAESMPTHSCGRLSWGSQPLWEHSFTCPFDRYLRNLKWLSQDGNSNILEKFHLN